MVLINLKTALKLSNNNIDDQFANLGKMVGLQAEINLMLKNIFYYLYKLESTISVNNCFHIMDG